MNYASIRDCDIANGEGVRVSLFVSGCTHHCPGCFNAEAQAFDYGEPFTIEVENRVLDALAPAHIAGLTLLGGEPMEPANQRALVPFLRRFRERYGKRKTLWVYTGCVYEELKGGKVEEWRGGEVEKWRGGEVEELRSGEVEELRSGEVEKWRGGEVEELRSGEVEECNDSTTSPLHHSTTPPLHHSTIPPLHHSTTPPLHHSTSCWRTEVTDEYLSMVDVLVDGPFVESLKNISLPFRGSSNQRILHLRDGRIVE